MAGTVEFGFIQEFEEDMSGPKAHHYRVTSAEEIRRREDAARRLRCESLVSKCQLEASNLESPKSAKIPRLTDSSHEALLRWETELNNALKDIILQADKENAKRVVKRLRSHMTEIDVSGVTLGGRKASIAQRAQRQDSFIEHEIADLAPQLGRIRDKKRASELEKSFERLTEYDDEALVKGDLLTLKSKLNDLLFQQDMFDMAQNELLRIAHVDGEEADALRREAEFVKTKKEFDVIKSRVSELLAAEKAKLDEAFVTKALEEILSDLGFEISGGFEVTDFGRVAIAESEDYPGYALRMQVNPKNGMLFTRMVSFEVHDAETDESVERESCQSIRLLRERLSKKGIEAELTSERAPGERPVELLDAGAVAARLERRRRANAGKVMINAR